MSLNRDWSSQFNLSGVTSQINNNRSDVKAPKGFYVVTIDDCYIDTSKNTNLVKFRMTVSQGEFQGATVWGSLMQIGSTKHDNRKYWRALYESIGLQPAQLDQGAFNFSGRDFIGQSSHVFWQPGDRDKGVYDECSFMAPAQWQTQKQQFEATATAQGSALATPAAPSVPSAPSVQPAVQTISAPAPTQGFAQPVPQAGFVDNNSVQSVNLQNILGNRPN